MMNKYRLCMLSVIAALGLGLVITYNSRIVMWVVDSHLTFYSEMFHVVDTRQPNYLEDHVQDVMISRFYTILWIDGYISEEGVLREGVTINAMTFSADKEYMRAHYTVDGEDKEFYTRYPWKSMPQRKYEEHVIGARLHPLVTP